MRMTDGGRILFALSFAAAGALMLGFHDFGLMWIPKIVPWRDVPAIIAGGLVLLGGLGLLVPRTAGASALLLALLLAVRFLFQMRFVVAEPLVEVHYEVIGETMAQFAGAWTIFAMQGAAAPFGGFRTGQILFGLALLPCGLSHFFYMNMTAPLIPSWIPFHVPLGYITGACHFAAGVAILANVVPRLAATLEAIMVSLFTIIIWVPAVAAAPLSRSNWGEIFASAAISGAAFLVAGSYSESTGAE